MSIAVAEVAALFRYPVKSMAGERIESSELGWHGLAGDRRLAWRRIDERGGFPWLTASKLPRLILYSPVQLEPSKSAALPSHVRTPQGEELGLFSAELANEVGGHHGAPVEMMHLDRGIFDEASVSLISAATIDELGRLAGQPLDVRRFRPNILLSSLGAAPFEEDDWLGGTLSFGDSDRGAALAVTNLDERCSMVTFDPDSARSTPEILKTIVRTRNNRAGIYAAVVRRGRVAVGDPVYFEPAARAGADRESPGG